jgi:hypothetical protein
LSGTAPNLTYTPTPNATGADSFTFKVTSGGVDSAPATVAITVTAVNDMPTISDIANQSTSQGTTSGPHSFTVDDVETAAANLMPSGTSSNPTLVPDASIVFGGSGASRTVTVTPAANQTGTATITVTVTDGNSGTKSDTFLLTVTAALTATTTTTPTSTLNPSTYGQAVTFTASVAGAGGTPTGTMTFYDNGVSLGSAPVNASGAASLTTSLVAVSAVGVPRSITAVYSGDTRFSGSTSAGFAQTVNKAATTSALAVTPLSAQYSDLETFEVTVSGANGEAPAQGAIFKIGTQQMNATPIAFVSAGSGVWRARATLPLLESGVAGQLRPNGMSKIVSATLSGISANYTVPNPSSKTLLINKEDARVTYSGARMVQTTSGGSTATIPLVANVRDIANTVDANGDTTLGDIRLAQVMFVNRATGAAIGTVNVALDPNSPNDGIATFNWNVDIGTNLTQDFTVGFVVTNYYNRNSTTENAVITVTK